jgi:hypothetical protein
MAKSASCTAATWAGVNAAPFSIPINAAVIDRRYRVGSPHFQARSAVVASVGHWERAQASAWTARRRRAPDTMRPSKWGLAALPIPESRA